MRVLETRGTGVKPLRHPRNMLRGAKLGCSGARESGPAGAGAHSESCTYLGTHTDAPPAHQRCKVALDCLTLPGSHWTLLMSLRVALDLERFAEEGRMKETKGKLKGTELGTAGSSALQGGKALTLLPLPE